MNKSSEQVSEVLEVTTRLDRCFRTMGATTLAELAARSQTDLLSMSGFGPVTLRELNEEMAKQGYIVRDGGFVATPERLAFDKKASEEGPQDHVVISHNKVFIGPSTRDQVEEHLRRNGYKPLGEFVREQEEGVWVLVQNTVRIFKKT